MDLEERLEHFVEWLKNYGVHMTWADPNVPVTVGDIDWLVEEYVNT